MDRLERVVHVLQPTNDWMTECGLQRGARPKIATSQDKDTCGICRALVNLRKTA